MTKQDRIHFECMIMDYAEGIKDAEEIGNLAKELHECIDNALNDYAMDHDIDYFDTYD